MNKSLYSTHPPLSSKISHYTAQLEKQPESSLKFHCINRPIILRPGGSSFPSYLRPRLTGPISTILIEPPRNHLLIYLFFLPI